MQSLRKINTIILYSSILIVITIMLQACGEKKDGTDGSTIKFNPTAHSQSGIAADTCVNFDVIVLYSDSTPRPKAFVTLFGPFAEPRNIADQSPRYQFYLFPNCELSGTVNQKVDSGFQVETNDQGIYSFSVNIYSTVSGSINTFKDEIEAHSGTAFGSAGVEVN